MSHQGSSEHRHPDRVERAGQIFRRYVDVALVVIGGVKDVDAAVYPLFADWKRRNRR